MENITSEKPKAKVIGQNGNVFVTLGICTQALKKAGLREQADELTEKVFGADNYNKALNIMQEYCTFI